LLTLILIASLWMFDQMVKLPVKNSIRYSNSLSMHTLPVAIRRMPGLRAIFERPIEKEQVPRDTYEIDKFGKGRLYRWIPPRHLWCTTLVSRSPVPGEMPMAMRSLHHRDIQGTRGRSLSTGSRRERLFVPGSRRIDLSLSFLWS
jgi:hypothetical protein